MKNKICKKFGTFATPSILVSRSVAGFPLGFFVPPPGVDLPTGFVVFVGDFTILKLNSSIFIPEKKVGLGVVIL